MNYRWDANCNLLNDGISTYTYDPANRLAGVTQGSNTYTYAYNGSGDRLQQTVNEQTTNYTLDLNAGLTQVLEDGTNTYTYGLDRISQQHGSTAEYYLGDALGSVRQMTDASDAITFSESYDPYGKAIQSAGSSTSIFGYTGEQADSYIKLINLRSRLYDPASGRFLTKDSWQGDYNRPASYNAWLYVYANPVMLADPTGKIPTFWEVLQGKQVYSCNCGWIDFGHARSGVANSVLKLLELGEEQAPSAGSGYRNDVYAISPTISDVQGIGPVSITAVVKRGLDENTKNSVALGIYRALEETVENKQENKNSIWAMITGYSFEDLPSDEIGFYLALKFRTVDPTDIQGGKNLEARQWLASTCGFPFDKEEAKAQSGEAYKAFGGIAGFLRLNLKNWDTWDSPLLCKVEGICKNEPQSWPSDFTQVSPISAQRGGLWWFYNPSQDGELISIKDNFYYIK